MSRRIAGLWCFGCVAVSTVALGARGERRGDGPFILLGLAYALYACLLLPGLAYNFDEGVYIQQAVRIRDGATPFVDFFAHQPPLYIFTLAPLSGLAGGSPVPFRALSLVATLGAAFAIFRLARRQVPTGGALLAAALFLSAPLQYFGLLAIPNAAAGALACAGVALLWLGRSRAALAIGAACLVVATLYKPVMISTALAVGVALLASKERRGTLPWIALSGGGVALLSAALFHVLSDGAFTEVVVAQLGRTLGTTGAEIFGGFQPFAEEAARRGVDSPLAWSLSVHAKSFLSLELRHANGGLLAAALAGQILLWTPAGRRWREHRVLLTAWWLLPLSCFLFLWDPVWNHYLLQYLPPLALLAALFATWLFEISGRGARALLVVAVGVLVAVGPFALRDRGLDYSRLARPDAAGQRWLTFDPFLNLVTGTEPACGLIDPFNVYGENAIAYHFGKEKSGKEESEGAAARAWRPSEYAVGAPELIACLEREPDVKIALGYWSRWFVDDELRAYLDAQPPERFVSLGLRDL